MNAQSLTNTVEPPAATCALRRVLVVAQEPVMSDRLQKMLSGRHAGGAETPPDNDQGGPLSTAEGAFEIDWESQVLEAPTLISQAAEEGFPYAVVLADVSTLSSPSRLDLIGDLWRADPALQLAVCCAPADCESCRQIVATLPLRDQLLILKKPVEDIELAQAVRTLTAKWNLSRSGRPDAERREEQESRLSELRESLEETQNQLLQYGKMASIGQLAAGVAHEINNPVAFISSNLNTLVNYVEDVTRLLEAFDNLLSKCGESPADLSSDVEKVGRLREEIDLDYLLGDLKSLLDESIEGVCRVRKIVMDLRDFSHVDRPDAEPADINQLMQTAIRLASNELKYKTEIVREYGEIPTLPCYGSQLGQVFLNLLVNAAHAIEKGGQVIVRTGVVEDRIWVEVADSGHGIPANIRDRIFEPFFTTKDVGKGTGLGLHLSYKLVKAHGGEILVDSTIGKGTTFRIELPLSGRPDAVEERQSDPSV